MDWDGVGRIEMEWDGLGWGRDSFGWIGMDWDDNMISFFNERFVLVGF